MILRNGVRDALLAAVLFGLSAPIGKILVGDLPPQLLAGVLYLGSGMGLTIVALQARLYPVGLVRLLRPSRLSSP